MNRPPLDRNIEPLVRYLFGCDGVDHGFSSQQVDTAVAALCAALQPRRLSAGEVLIREGETHGTIYFIAEGEVAILNGDRVSAILPAPNSVGLVSILDGQARSATVCGMPGGGETILYALARDTFERLIVDHPALSRGLLAHVATQLRKRYEVHGRLLHSIDDFFFSPGARIVPGPYYTEPFEMILAIMQSDAPESLAKLLPRGLSPLPGLSDLYLLTFNFIEGKQSRHPAAAGRKYAYRETCPFIPCLGPVLALRRLDRAALACDEPRARLRHGPSRCASPGQGAVARRRANASRRPSRQAVARQRRRPKGRAHRKAHRRPPPAVLSGAARNHERARFASAGIRT